MFAAIVAVGLAVCLSSGHAQPVKSAAPIPPPIPEKLPKPFAVVPFESRSDNGPWLKISLPFLLGEMAEVHPGLRPMYGPLVVANEVFDNDPERIAQFARREGAEWVFGGWFRRSDVELELAIVLWSVKGQGPAARIGEASSKGPSATLIARMAQGFATLCQKGGVPLPADRKGLVTREPYRDQYALTLFGRGLAAMVGIGGTQDLAKARKDLERAVFIDPTLAPGHRVLGELNLLEGQSRKAKNELEYAMEVRSDYPMAALSLARAERAGGKREVARELWLLLLQARPWDLETRYQLGTLLWETSDVEGSYRELSQVVKFWPRDERVRRALVVIHANRGDTVALVRELEKVVELAPQDQEAKLDLAAAYGAQGRDDQAIATYQAVITADASNVHALKLMGDLYRQKGMLPSAIKYYALAMDARPGDPRPYFLLGAAYLETGDDVQAKRVYSKAQRFKEFLPEVHNNLGAIAYREGNLKESLAYLKKAVVARPNKVRYRYNYALSLSKTEAIDEALANIVAGLKLDGNYAELHYLRGVVLLRKGDAKGARQSFQRTLELEPEHTGAAHNLERLDELERREKQGEVIVEEPE